MARAKRSTPKRHPFYAALAALGCTYCGTSAAYMYPGHVDHVAAFAFDQHASRYAIVGGYGNVRLVDLTADVADMSEVA